MSSWYGQSSTKQQIEALLEKKPKLTDLFAINEFCQELKSFNPKLLDYISNTPQLIKEAIAFITVAPSLTDSHDRKYKLPLNATEMIETETTCVLNSFFKENKEANGLYFDLLFGILNSAEVLPLLAGYFFRVNIGLLNTRFKETTDRVYGNPGWLYKLLQHSEHMPMANVLQLYINLDVNKTISSQNQSERVAIKMQVIGKIMAKIASEGRMKNANSCAIIDNLTGILVETIEKYYLIADGKQMMDVITSQTSIDTYLGLLKESGELAYPAMHFFIALINYYSFSSLNSEEKHNPDLARRNLERLQSQPMIVGINGYFKEAMDRIMSSPRMTLHNYRILEVLCHMISISSKNLLNTIRQTKFFESLITLLFRFQQSSILHMLIEKAFLHLFISERAIYDQYKKHLFCELDIIRITATSFMEKFDDQLALEKAKKKGYFGHFMRILKIYSGVQTTDQEIVSAIKDKGEIWNKISKMVIKPYEAICYKELGSYTDIPQPTTLEFKVKRNILEGVSIQNSNAIEQIKREEEIKNIKAIESIPNDSGKKQEESCSSPFNGSADKYTEDIFKIASNNFLEQSPQLNQDNPKRVDAYLQQKKSDDSKEPETNRNQSFQEYITKKKEEVGQHIRMQRSLSTDRRLSGNKAKLASPSPRKKNSWKDDNEKSLGEKSLNSSISRYEISTHQTEKDNRISKISTNNNHGLSQSTLVERTNHHLSEDNSDSREKAAKSMVNLESLKKIKVIQIDKPAEKKYRRIQEKDKVLLDFLGVAY